MKNIFRNILVGLLDFLSATIYLLFVIVGITDIPKTKGFEAVLLFMITLIFGGLFFGVMHTIGKSQKGGGE